MQWDGPACLLHVEELYGASDQPAVVVNSGLSIVWTNNCAITRYPFFISQDGLMNLIKPADGVRAKNAIENKKNISFYAGSLPLSATRVFFSPLPDKKGLAFSLVLFETTAPGQQIKQEEAESTIAVYSGQSRGPLNRIFLSLNMLANKQVVLKDKTLMQLIKNISQNSYRLLRHSINMTEYHRFICGIGELEVKTVNLCAQIRQLCVASEKLMLQSAIRLEFSVPQDAAYCLCDWDLIELALLNILSNSCRFLQNDHLITMELNKQNHQILITVSDHGSGISPETLPHIFKPFFSTVDVVAETSGGGLGLTVAKLCIEAFGGAITINTVQESGTTVLISLPLAPPPEYPVLKAYESMDLMHDRFSNLYVILSDVCLSPWP